MNEHYYKTNIYSDIVINGRRYTERAGYHKIIRVTVLTRKPLQLFLKQATNINTHHYSPQLSSNNDRQKREAASWEKICIK